MSGLKRSSSCETKPPSTGRVVRVVWTLFPRAIPGYLRFDDDTPTGNPGRAFFRPDYSDEYMSMTNFIRRIRLSNPGLFEEARASQSDIVFLRVCKGDSWCNFFLVPDRYATSKKDISSFIAWPSLRTNDVGLSVEGAPETEDAALAEVRHLSAPLDPSPYLVASDPLRSIIGHALRFLDIEDNVRAGTVVRVHRDVIDGPIWFIVSLGTSFARVPYEDILDPPPSDGILWPNQTDAQLLEVEDLCRTFQMIPMKV